VFACFKGQGHTRYGQGHNCVDTSLHTGAGFI